MQGLHLTADLHYCRCATHWLLDAETLGAACIAAVEATPDVYVCNFGGAHSAKTHALLNAQVALVAAVSA